VASSTVEDYLKAILTLGIESHASVISTGAIADKLGVSHGTASKTIRSLAKVGFARCWVHKGAELTEEGRLLAMRVVRKHRLVELFLTTVLNMEWDEVHSDAELLEHAVSDRLAGYIDQYLGHPVVDPHGDPIPTLDGEFPENGQVSLSQCGDGTQFVIGRILDQSHRTLRYLSVVGVRTGAEGYVITQSDLAGTTSVVIGGRTLYFGQSVASQILVILRRDDPDGIESASAHLDGADAAARQIIE